MKIAETDFPVYRVLLKNSQYQKKAVESLELANKGTLEDKFMFVQAMYLAADPRVASKLEGFTWETGDATFAACRRAFEELAELGHAGSAFYCAMFNIYGIGGLKDLHRAEEWIEIARMIGAEPQELISLEEGLRIAAGTMKKS